MPENREVLDAFRQAQADLAYLKVQVGGMRPGPLGWDLRDQVIKLIEINGTLAEATRRHLRALGTMIDPPAIGRGEEAGDA